MKDRDELIRSLVQAVQARAGNDSSLKLPDTWDETAWRKLLEPAEVLELTGGEVLLKRNDPSNDLYFLVSGKLEVSVLRANSVSMTPLATVEPGTVVGEIAFFDDRSRSAAVWSRGDSIVFRLRRSDFQAFRRAQPELASDLLFALARILADRLRRTIAGADGSGSSSGFNSGY